MIKGMKNKSTAISRSRSRSASKASKTKQAKNIKAKTEKVVKKEEKHVPEPKEKVTKVVAVDNKAKSPLKRTRTMAAIIKQTKEELGDDLSKYGSYYKDKDNKHEEEKKSDASEES